MSRGRTGVATSSTARRPATTAWRKRSPEPDGAVAPPGSIRPSASARHAIVLGLTVTVAHTLGVLLLTEGRTPLRLVLIPVLWSLVGGTAAWLLSVPEDLALPLAGLGGLGLILWKNRRLA